MRPQLLHRQLPASAPLIEREQPHAFDEAVGNVRVHFHGNLTVPTLRLQDASQADVLVAHSLPFVAPASCRLSRAHLALATRRCSPEPYSRISSA